MHKLKIKAVIFDMDGVITDTMVYHLRAWKKIFRRECLNVSKYEIYLREGQPGYITIKSIFKEHRIPCDESRIQKMLGDKERLFTSILRRRFIRGSRPFLHFLKKEGFRLALVTGTARHEVARILPKSLLRMFDVVVTGSEVKKGKPHPEPYLMALKKLALKSSEAFVIENAPFGIRSAKRARLLCVALETSLPKRFLKGADYIFHSYKEMRQKLSFSVS